MSRLRKFFGVLFSASGSRGEIGLSIRSARYVERERFSAYRRREVFHVRFVDASSTGCV